MGIFIIPYQYNKFYLLDLDSIDRLMKNGILPSKALYICRISDLTLTYDGEQIDVYELYTKNITVRDEMISSPSCITLDDHHNMIIQDADIDELIEQKEN